MEQKPLKNKAISRHIFTYPISVTKRPDRRSNAPMHKHTSPTPAAFAGELVPTQAAQTCLRVSTTWTKSDRSELLLPLLLKMAWVTTQALSFCRGTQREYSSKPLKHSIVERIVVFKRYPLKIFHLFGFRS